VLVNVTVYACIEFCHRGVLDTEHMSAMDGDQAKSVDMSSAGHNLLRMRARVVPNAFSLFVKLGPPVDGRDK